MTPAPREPTATQKSAWKWLLRPFVTSCTKDDKGLSLLQTIFTELPNIGLYVLENCCRMGFVGELISPDGEDKLKCFGRAKAHKNLKRFIRAGESG